MRISTGPIPQSKPRPEPKPKSPEQLRKDAERKAQQEAELERARQIERPAPLPLDEDEWKEMARVLHVSLPRTNEQMSAEKMLGFLEKLGKSKSWYKRETGEDLEDFIFENPQWTIRHWAGIVLEMVARERK